MEYRVKTSELPIIKKKLIAKQNGVCPLCGNSLLTKPSRDVVVDHCHKTGYIRAALCRGCNGVEGKIINLVMRFGKSARVEYFIERLLNYWKLHRSPQTEWIHPTHKTEDEKRLLRNKKAREARARKKVGL